MFDVAIIGAGVVGASIFNKLVRKNKNVVLIEKNDDVSLGASRANSGIVHAGFDCKPNTLKARFNVEGNLMMEGLAKELDIPFKRIGAFVVGDNQEMIDELYDRSLKNGVLDVEKLNREKLLEYIPNLSENITCALYAKTSGIISPYLLTIALAEQAVMNGGKFENNFEVADIEKYKDKFIIKSKEGKIIEAKKIINSCGAGYNEIANLLKVEEYPLIFRRGEYYLLDNTCFNFVKHTIFPLPTKYGKGVLVTPTMDGNILVGPTSYDSDTSTITTKEGLNSIRENVGKMLNNVPLNKTIRVFSGVRVISGDDFIIEKSKKDENVINLAGICSPGLSSAPAIAKYVVEELLEIKETDKKMIERKNYTSVRDLSDEKLNALIKKDSSYGRIVCKCENITEGEIIEAIKSPLKPISVDAIKRRVRAGMGRCQGGFCFMKVAELISKYANISLDEVCKENKNSNFVIGNIKEI